MQGDRRYFLLCEQQTGGFVSLPQWVFNKGVIKETGGTTKKGLRKPTGAVLGSWETVKPPETCIRPGPRETLFPSRLSWTMGTFCQKEGLVMLQLG